MIDKNDVIEFFDKRAAGWDAELIRDDAAVECILDNAGVTAGIRVLDVACGTGVLFGDYLKRGVTSVTGIDISPEMAKLAAEKFPQENIEVICGDVETAEFGKDFDLVMVYNAFPHFPDPEQLIKTLAAKLRPGGRLCIAHGMSRDKIDSHHHSVAAHKVTMGLMHEGELVKLFEPYFAVDTVISDERMYQISGVKR